MSFLGDVGEAIHFEIVKKWRIFMIPGMCFATRESKKEKQS